MLKLAPDADVHGAVARAIRDDNMDLVRVQDALPVGATDPEVLEWTASQGRVLISNDHKTMIGYARERARNKKSMPGLIVLPDARQIARHVGALSKEIILIARVCDAEELRLHQVVFLPLKRGDLRPLDPSLPLPLPQE